MGKLIDMTGQKWGRLTVLEKSTTPRANKKAYWVCQCECGNLTEVCGVALRNGKTQSCGCLQKERTSKVSKKDLTGQKFGRLLVLEDVGRTENKNVLWKCLCDCGKETVVMGTSLLQGKTQSCGCYNKERTSETSRKDISGQRFGRLIAERPTDLRTVGQKVIWECKCDCGAITTATCDALLSGKMRSCGCLKSIGEEFIAKILTLNQIKFKKEKTFEDCLGKDNKTKLRFDFWVNEEYLIEYDGQQHFDWTGYGWDSEKKYQQTVYYDKIKNEYCLSHNIPLIRIPYTHLTELCIEDLLLESSNFIIKKEQED